MLYEPGTNKRPVYFRFDLRLTFSILFGHAFHIIFPKMTFFL